MNRIFVWLFILLTMLLSVGPAYAAGSPVVVTHTLTGHSKGAEAVTLDYALHVVNTGDAALSDLSLVLVPRPLMTKMTTVSVGNLGPHESTDIPLRVVTAARFDKEKSAQAPLSWAGTCVDAMGNPVEFPVKSRPGVAK